MEMCSIISIKSKNVYSMSRPPVTSMPEIRWIFHGYYEIFESQTAGHKCATSLCWCLVQENKIDSGKTRRETLTKGIFKIRTKNHCDYKVPFDFGANIPSTSSQQMHFIFAWATLRLSDKFMNDRSLDVC